MDQEIKPKNKKKKPWIIAGAVILFLAVVGIAGMKYHEKPQFCATCHVMEPYLQSWTGETKDSSGKELLAYTHGVEGITCLNCHPASIDQQVSELVTYVKGDFDEPLKTRKFPNEFCTHCHSNEEERIAATENYVVHFTVSDEFKAKLISQGNEALINETSVTINPHTIGVDSTDPNNPHHEGAQKPECNVCHKSHQASPEINYCYTCHHTRTLISCSACHGGE